MAAVRRKAMWVALVVMTVPAALAVPVALATDPPVSCAAFPGLQAPDPWALLAPGQECTGGGQNCGLLPPCWENRYHEDFEGGNAPGWAMGTSWGVRFEPCGMSTHVMSRTGTWCNDYQGFSCARTPSVDVGGDERVRVMFVHTLALGGGSARADLSWDDGDGNWNELQTWNQSTGGTVEHILDPPPNIRIRFCFERVSGGPPGWFLDDVRVDGCPTYQCADP